jgi:hypothetical protein
VGNDSLDGHLDPFVPSIPIVGHRAELYVRELPKEKFDAYVVRITACRLSWCIADIRLVRPDVRLYRGIRFEGVIVD